MSVPDIKPPDPQRPAGLGGCMMAFLIILGILMLLPGLCALIFLVELHPSRSDMNAIIAIGFITFLIGAAGVGLIVLAVRNR
jgi:hypothetical protein